MGRKSYRKKTSRSRRGKTSTGRVYIAVIMLFMVGVMSIQIFNLYNKNVELKETQEALEKQVEAANEKKQELKEYESYVGSDDYIEDQASQKLGLTHDNWIIFREKED